MPTDGQAPAASAWFHLVMETTALKGWTKAELSDRSGVARSTIDGWARNPRPPQARSVVAVADTLGIDRAEAVRLAGIVTVGPAHADEPERISAHLRREIERELKDPERTARAIAYIEGELSGPGAGRDEPEAPRQAG